MLHMKLNRIAKQQHANILLQIPSLRPSDPVVKSQLGRADRGTIIMKHIKRDFGSKTCAGPTWWT